MKLQKMFSRLKVSPGKSVSLKEDFDPGWLPEGLQKGAARQLLKEGIRELARYQDLLYAQDVYALLIVFQAMDAAGKDSTIKHVMSGLNPQGCQVYSFKAPSAEELDHDYLWRCCRALPERGRIGIFNRSYYEEVLIVRVHPEILDRQRLPPGPSEESIWERRFREINQFERHLVDNGTVVLKFFLHLSKEEQKQRFLERIDRPEKNWKFSLNDVRERGCWSDYRAAYEDMLSKTSTSYAPWYVVPADHKWLTRLAVGSVILRTLEGLKLSYPEVSEEHRRELVEGRRLLEAE